MRILGDLRRTGFAFWVLPADVVDIVGGDEAAFCSLIFCEVEAVLDLVGVGFLFQLYSRV